MLEEYTSKPRILLLTERVLQLGNFRSLQEAFDGAFEVHRVFMDDAWASSISEIAGRNDFDAAISFVRFSQLVNRPSFDWKGFSGVRIAYDQDVSQDAFNLSGDRTFRGAWHGTMRRYDFDILVCTNRSSAERLGRQGIRTAWVPKAYDASVFHDLGRRRNGAVHYGSTYPPRQAMLRAIRRRGIPVRQVDAPYSMLNDALNDFAIALVCTMQMRPIIPSSWVARRLGWFGQRLLPGPEVMLKNFEAAGAGCAVFCDASPDLDALGFRDGEHVVTYKNFTQLGDRLEQFLADPDDLEAIRRRGAAFCREHHTWDKRMLLFDQLVRGGELAV